MPPKKKSCQGAFAPAVRREMPSNLPDELAIVRLQPDHVVACSELEARAFNVWRRKWGEPLQPPRRRDWLAYIIQLYPHCVSAALIGNEVIGYGMVHVWGTLGWIGPVAVEPEWQAHGIGSALTRWGLHTLQNQDCQTIALETWPNSPHNIGFYACLGFNPGPLIAVVEKAIAGEGIPFTGDQFGAASQSDPLLAPLAEMTLSIASGLDYGPLIRATMDCQMGRVIVWGPADQPDAMAIVHTAPHHEGPSPSHANVELLVVRHVQGERSHGGNTVRQLYEKLLFDHLPSFLVKLDGLLFRKQPDDLFGWITLQEDLDQVAQVPVPVPGLAGALA